MNLKQQIRRLLALELVGNFRVAGGVWVLLLVGRGFSLVQVGLAEAFFHAVSLCGEIPSGMAADVLGRKKAMMASQAMFILSSLAMLLSRTMAGVCAAMALSALAYNLASGTREALTYDSLVQGRAEDAYLRVSSLQNSLWRLASGLSTLCAGLAVAIGYQAGYAADALLALAGLLLAGSLAEPVVTASQAQRAGQRLRDLPRLVASCAREAAGFLHAHPRVSVLMLYNALVGALATLLRFFLQDGLIRAGASPALLGPLLLAIELGGVAGARLALPLSRLPYRAAGLLCGLGTLAGLLLPLSGSVLQMAAGGFLAVVCDDAFQTLTDARLNNRFPSDQRATLISVSSMCFSLVMIALSPLAGAAAGFVF